MVGDGYVSDPLTDTLGLRIAFYGNRLRGWLKNIAPEPFRAHDHLPRDRELATQFTLRYAPSDVFDAKLKFYYGSLKAAGTIETGQYIFCPAGTPEFADQTECKANNTVYRPSFGPIEGR